MNCKAAWHTSLLRKAFLKLNKKKSWITQGTFWKMYQDFVSSKIFKCFQAWSPLIWQARLANVNVVSNATWEPSRNSEQTWWTHLHELILLKQDNGLENLPQRKPSLLSSYTCHRPAEIIKINFTTLQAVSVTLISVSQNWPHHYIV